MFLLAQLSDPHIGATWGGGDPAASWQAAIDAVCRLHDRPDAVLVTGDLADTGADTEYALVKSMLARLDAPAYVLPGNHDDRARLRDHFALSGGPHDPVDYAVDLGPVRLVVLDTTKPGDDAGTLGRQQLAWLESELSAAPDQVTLLAMHHPPFATGLPACDAVGLAALAQAALADVVARHPQVSRIVAGHVHRPMTADVGGCIAFSSPSTYVQIQLGFADAEMVLSDEPAGFALHAVHGDAVVSHVQLVDGRPGA
jgi:3',5'-cyclic AMP phosphodiesterase CpdA